MRVFEAMRASAIGLSVLMVVGGLALIYGSDVFFDESASGDLSEVDFENLVPDSGYLVCPRYLCLAGEPDAEAPLYDFPLTKLRAIVLEFVESQPGVSTRSINFELQQYEFIELTPSMRTPDVIAIRFFPLSENSATLAIYSYTPISEGDNERNRLRVERWLRFIDPNGTL